MGKYNSSRGKSIMKLKDKRQQKCPAANNQVFVMKKTLILLTLCIMASMTSFGQKKRKEYQLPPHDFVTFTQNPYGSDISERDTSVYLLKVDTFALEHSINFARKMSSIPPTIVTFYDKGYCTGCELACCWLRICRPEEEVEPKTKLEKKTETFLSLGDYEDKRKELLDKENIYILEKECENIFGLRKEISNNDTYILIWYEY